MHTTLTSVAVQLLPRHTPSLLRRLCECAPLTPPKVSSIPGRLTRHGILSPSINAQPLIHAEADSAASSPARLPAANIDDALPPTRFDPAAYARRNQNIGPREDHSAAAAEHSHLQSQHQPSYTVHTPPQSSSSASSSSHRPPRTSRAPLSIRNKQMFTNAQEVHDDPAFNRHLDLEGHQMWESWPGNNRPFMKGRALCGPDSGVIGCNIFLIVFVSSLYVIIDIVLIDL